MSPEEFSVEEEAQVLLVGSRHRGRNFFFLKMVSVAFLLGIFLLKILGQQDLRRILVTEEDRKSKIIKN